jgi:predicted Zn finger-like uncharacterized protein
MILTCPDCGTQYVVKDGAIPPGGRQVRCASCKHSWHQDPEELTLGSEQEVTPAADRPAEEIPPQQVAETPAEPEAHVPDSDTHAPEAADEDETFAEAAIIDPSTGPEAEERAYEESLIEFGPPSEEQAAAVTAAPESEPEAEPSDYYGLRHADGRSDDEFSPFAARDALEPKRRSPLIAILVVAVLIAAAAAAFWFAAPPEWKAKLGVAETKTPLQLSNPPRVDLSPLASGQQLLTVSGKVINPTDQAHPVPPIHAELYGHGGKVIYTWIIQPPTPVLGPGASASFNSAEVNVPSGSEGVTVSLGPKA